MLRKARNMIMLVLLAMLLAGANSCTTRGVMLQDGEVDYHDLDDQNALDEQLMENAEIDVDDSNERY